MTYVYLALATAFEVGWALGLKWSDGFRRPWPSAATGVMYLLSIAFLVQVTKKMEVGVAYAIWAGLGMVLIAVLGIALFGERSSALKLGSVALIVLGVVGLHLADSPHP